MSSSKLSFFETPTSDYSHLGAPAAFAGIQQRSGRCASEHKKELMRRRKRSRGMESQTESELTRKPQDQRQQRDGQVRRRSSKTNVAAPRIRHHQDKKKGVCAHLTWTPVGWMVSRLSSCAVQSITYSQCSEIRQLSRIAAPNFPSFRVSSSFCHFILSVQWFKSLECNIYLLIFPWVN